MRNTMQGLKVLPTIVDEITKVNELLTDRQMHIRTNRQETGCLCCTMPADATKIKKQTRKVNKQCLSHTHQTPGPKHNGCTDRKMDIQMEEKNNIPHPQIQFVVA